MPVPTSLKRRLLRELPRTEVKTAADVTSADDPLFTVSGGNVLITEIVGEVTTLHSSTSNLSRLKFNPTAATVNDINLSGTVELNAATVGTLYTISGQFSEVAILGSAAEGLDTKGFILQPGDLELECSASPAAGALSWTIKWIAIDDGASVAAA